MGSLCYVREYSVQFIVQFFLHSWTVQFNFGVQGAL